MAAARVAEKAAMATMVAFAAVAEHQGTVEAERVKAGLVVAERAAAAAA
jgi:hypothetical protein